MICWIIIKDRRVSFLRHRTQYLTMETKNQPACGKIGKPGPAGFSGAVTSPQATVLELTAPTLNNYQRWAPFTKFWNTEPSIRDQEPNDLRKDRKTRPNRYRRSGNIPWSRSVRTDGTNAQNLSSGRPRVIKGCLGMVILMFMLNAITPVTGVYCMFPFTPSQGEVEMPARSSAARMIAIVVSLFVRDYLPLFIFESIAGTHDCVVAIVLGLKGRTLSWRGRTYLFL